MRKISLAAHVSLFAILILSAVLFAQHPESNSSPSHILGFTAAHARAEHRLEADFQSIPSPEKAREWHRTFTAGPHPGAAERNTQLGEFPADGRGKIGKALCSGR